MKLPILKKVVIKCDLKDKDNVNVGWEDEIVIDPTIFDDILLEACTQAVEKRKNEPGFCLGMTLECYDKKNSKDPNAHYCYNTYFVMINASMHQKAEMLRSNFMKLYKVDLKVESLKGEDGNELSDKPVI
jgi:hypothetical protein